jgi:hypothetical protein
MKGDTVTARMSMPGKGGLPSGKTFCIELRPTAKRDSRQALTKDAIEGENRLLLLQFIAAFLPGATIHPAPHQLQDAFASLIVSETTIVVSAWYVHDGDAARAQRRMGKAEEVERLRQKKLESKAEERERERQ